MKVKIRNTYIDLSTINAIEIKKDCLLNSPLTINLRLEKLVFKNIFGGADIEIVQKGLEDMEGLEVITIYENSPEEEKESLKVLVESEEFYHITYEEKGVRIIDFIKKESIKNRWEKEKQFAIESWERTKFNIEEYKSI